MTSRESAAPNARSIVIAIDGPAASGKSSTARRVAERLHLRHIDSGALYRAATAASLRTQRDPATWTAQTVLRAAANISLIPSTRSFSPSLDGEVMEGELRAADVTATVSRVAQMLPVREWVNSLVRKAANDHDVVVDGRDMGTTVFPDATLKVYLIADPWERARRRLIQTLGRSPSDEEIAAETERIVRRDAADATQSAAAKDAVLIDTTYVTQEEQVERIVALASSVIQGRTTRA